MMMTPAMREDLSQRADEFERFKQADYLRKMGEQGAGLAKSVARGVPQMATGLVDLAAMPFEAAGVLQPGQAVGSTKWLESKGYLPEQQKGFLNQTAELLSGGFDPSDLATKGLPLLAGIVGPDIARGLNTLRKLPEDEIFTQAVANTPGARITDEGLFMNLQRGQKPEQEAMESVRGGVFYLPEGSSNMKHYKKGDYGGQQMIEGETLINNPLFVKGATGGKAPEAAYDKLMGKGAYQKMRQEALQASGVMNLYGGGLTEADKAERIVRTLQEHGIEEHIAPDMARNMLQNSRSGNQLPYAIQEAIVGNAVRNAGHDVVLGHSKGKQGPFLSEVFDVREPYYPYDTGEAVDVWDTYKK